MESFPEPKSYPVPIVAVLLMTTTTILVMRLNTGSCSGKKIWCAVVYTRTA